MPRLRRAWWPVFALFLSCGGSDAVPTDTPDVAPATRASSWLVFDTEEGTLVYDDVDGAAFLVDGHPVRDVDAPPRDVWEEVGFVPNRRAWAPVTAGSILLVRSPRGIEAVDLADRGAVRARVQSGATDVTIAPDGRAFAAVDGSTVTIVDVASGRADAIAAPDVFTYPMPTWSDGWLTWGDRAAAHAFELDAHVDHRFDLAESRVARRGDRFVVWSAEEVRVVRGDELEVRIASAKVWDLTIDDAGKRVAWMEDRFVHTLDVERKVHLRFAARGTPCEISPETIDRIQGDLLVTNDECSPGCPSLEREPSWVAYDFATGALVRRWKDAVEPAPNDALGARIEDGERVAAAFGIERTTEIPLVRHPSEDRVVAASANGLRIAGAYDGATVVELEGSSGLSPTDAWFRKDGREVVAGTGIWDATTGRRLFRAGLSALP